MDPDEILYALDSPLCDTLAPELAGFRTTILEALRETDSGCTPCHEMAKARLRATIQMAMIDAINKTPAIAAVMPQLIATGKQAANVSL